MSSFTLIGLFLSALAVVLLAWLLYDCFSRPDEEMPTARLGDLEIGSTSIRWLWALLLVLGFVGGLYGYPLMTENSRQYTAEGRSPLVQSESRVERTIRLPFRVSKVTRAVSPEGATVSTTREERLQLPWIFLLVALLYWGIVRRRNRTGSEERRPPAGERSA